MEWDKPHDKRGLYLHPEVFGLPDELAISRSADVEENLATEDSE